MVEEHTKYQGLSRFEAIQMHKEVEARIREAKRKVASRIPAFIKKHAKVVHNTAAKLGKMGLFE